MLYGRDDERARIGALLDDARISQASAPLIVAEPGMGKTALLEDTRERAADMQVLTARGVQSESELPFAALHQLLRPALEHVDRIPAPQATALRGALGLGEKGSEDRFLVFAATLSLLAEFAERRPVLCLVDDVHWLDAASGDALQFVARRLGAEGIVMVFALREGETHAFSTADVPALHLTGLDAAAAGQLLAEAGAAPPEDVRDRLVRHTGGNALALLEIPGALTAAQLAGQEPLPDALPLTSQVEGLFLERVRRLPDETQRLLLVAAADDSESVALVTHAAGDPVAAADALDHAEREGLISVSGTRVVFRHPLVRSAVYAGATSRERRAAHRALADALAGDDDHLDSRAWHLASSSLEHDETVLAALDEAGARAQQRNAYAVATRAFERAADLSGTDRARSGRLVDAARSASIAGDDDHAAALAHRGLALTDDPLQRAELTRVLGLMEIRRGRPVDAPPRLI